MSPPHQSNSCIEILFLSDHPFASPCDFSSSLTVMGLATGLEAMGTEMAFASQEASSFSGHGYHGHTGFLAWSSTEQRGFGCPKPSPCTSFVSQALGWCPRNAGQPHLLRAAHSCAQPGWADTAPRLGPSITAPQLRGHSHRWMNL